MRTANGRVPRVKLTEEEKAEIIKLRSEDPETWTQRALAQRFNCSRLLIAMIAPAPKRPPYVPTAGRQRAVVQAVMLTSARVWWFIVRGTRTPDAEAAAKEAARKARRSLRNQAADLRRERLRAALLDPSQRGL